MVLEYLPTLGLFQITLGVNVGKYSSTMDPLGMLTLFGPGFFHHTPQLHGDLDRCFDPIEHGNFWVNLITSSLFERSLEIIVRIREIIPKWP